MFLLEIQPYHPDGHFEEYLEWNSSLSLFLRLNEDGWKTIFPSPSLLSFISSFTTNSNPPSSPEEFELFERVLLIIHRISSSLPALPSLIDPPYSIIPHLPPTSSRLIWIIMDILSSYPLPSPSLLSQLHPLSFLVHLLSTTTASNTNDASNNELQRAFSLFFTEEFSLSLSNILIISLALSKYTNYRQLATFLKNYKVANITETLSLFTDIIKSGDYKQELLPFTQELEKNRPSYDLLDDKSSLHLYKSKIIQSFQGDISASNQNIDEDDDNNYLDISSYRDSDDLSSLDIILMREYIRNEWIFGGGFKARGCKERRSLQERTLLTREQIEGWAQMLNRNKLKEPLLYDFKRMHG